MLRHLKQLFLTTLFALFASQASAMFIQPDWLDPTEPGVGTNRYSYSYNDPINRLDPNGNQSTSRGLTYRQTPQYQTQLAITNNLRAQIHQHNPNATWMSSNQPPTARSMNRQIQQLQRQLQQEQMASMLRYEALHGHTPTPRGFSSAESAQSFMQGINGGLRQAGYRDAIAILQGSSVTGTSYRTGEPFALNQTRSSITGQMRQSDRDVALAGSSIFQRASRLEGVTVRGAGTDNARILLNETHIQLLGLQRTYENAQRQGGGAPVNFMVYQNPSAAFGRSPSYLGSE